MKRTMMTDMGLNFIKCGLTGLCLEVIFTALCALAMGDVTCRGSTSLLMFPIYGMGCLLRPIGMYLEQYFKERRKLTEMALRQIILRGLLYMVLIFIGEYLSGLFLRYCGICPWDYTGRGPNIQGLVRLDFAPLWFGTGLLFEQITKPRFEWLSGRQLK